MTGRRLLPTLGALLFTALALAPSAGAATSPGVTRLGTIPERGLVSVRAVGDKLYTSSTSGVSIYDIANPRSPQLLGRLDLPNVQNEDVDVGNGILLVSDDPIGGRGILHVIDVSDPTKPRRLSTYSTWVPGLLEDFFGDVRRPNRRRGGIGHTATCIQGCRYAWLAGSTDGIEVVDLRNPRQPRLAGRFVARPAAGISTHDVQVDGQGLAWVAGGAGTAAYDTRRPARPRLVKRTDRRGRRGPLNDFIHHNSLRISPRTLLITEEDLKTGCRRAGSFQTWRIRKGGRVTPLDAFSVERNSRANVICSAHYFDHRDGLVAAGFYQQGLRLLDVSNPRRIRQVGFHIPSRPMAWGAEFAPTDPTGSVVYVIDHARGLDVVEIDRSQLRPVRRKPVRRRKAPRRFDAGVIVDDRFEKVRRGQRLHIRIDAGRFTRGGPRRRVRVRLQVPRALTGVRVPRGVRFDRRKRVVRFSVGLRRGGRRVISARVRRDRRPGSLIELIAYSRAPGDLLAVTDRAVDRTLVARRARRTRLPGAAGAAGTASASEAPSAYFCTLRRPSILRGRG